MKKFQLILVLFTYLAFACNNQHNHDHDKASLEEQNHEEHKHEDEDEHQHIDEHAHEHLEEAGHEEPDNHDDHEASDDQSDHSEHEEDEAYGIQEVVAKPFHEVIRTSGQIMAAQGDEITLTAIHEGVVVFNEKLLLSGKKVNKGDRLLAISGKELIHDNIESSFQDVKSQFDNANRNYNRALELSKDKIISDKELLETKIEYERLKNKYELLKRNFSTGGQQLTSTFTGFVKDVFVTEGEFVATGQPLIKLTKNKRLVIKADVPQRYFHMLDKIHSANFITAYDKHLYNIDDLNGRLVSFGKSTGANSLFTPVYFEVDNKGSLLSGSFIEVYLRTVEFPLCIVVPKSALLEENGRHYVFVEGHETFEKRYVEVDCNDGENYHITSGLKIGDHLVTKDPYRIKLSMLSNSLPAHGHSH